MSRRTTKATPVTMEKMNQLKEFIVKIKNGNVPEKVMNAFDKISVENMEIICAFIDDKIDSSSHHTIPQYIENIWFDMICQTQDFYECLGISN